MIIAPAYAPTDVDAKPEASSPTANNSATTGPRVSPTAAWAPSMESTPLAAPQRRRCQQQHRHVHRTGEQHRQPDIDAGDPQQPPTDRPCFGVTVTITCEAGVQVHRVRHDRRTEHRGCDQYAFGAVESGNQPGCRFGERWRFDDNAGQEPHGDDTEQPQDHELERTLTPAVLYQQQQHRYRSGDETPEQKR